MLFGAGDAIICIAGSYNNICYDSFANNSQQKHHLYALQSQTIPAEPQICTFCLN